MEHIKRGAFVEMARDAIVSVSLILSLDFRNNYNKTMCWTRSLCRICADGGRTFQKPCDTEQKRGGKARYMSRLLQISDSRLGLDW